MAPPKEPQPSSAEGELPFEYDWTPADEVLTAFAGIPLLVRAARSYGVPTSVKPHLRLKERQRSSLQVTQAHAVAPVSPCYPSNGVTAASWFWEQRASGLSLAVNGHDLILGQAAQPKQKHRFEHAA
jgi:hypothetical protein